MKNRFVLVLALLLVVLFSSANLKAQYCTPLVTNCSDERITNVTYTTINNTTGACVSPYNDFTAQIANVTIGATDQISVTIVLNFDGDYLYAFIDWNQNDVLDDAGEVYTLASNVGTSGAYTLDITVPNTALLGNTRMRVLVGFTASTPNPCEIPVQFGERWGEVEDYTVNVSGAALQFVAGISASNLNNGRLYSDGKCYDFTATVTNSGTDELPAGIPVYYTVNAGSPIGPVNTTAPIPSAGSEVVSFTGGLAFCPAGPGPYTINIYTQADPPVINNPVFPVILDVGTKITAFPYLETFTAPLGWTIFTEVFFGSVAPWSIAPCTNPDGLALDNAALSNFYGGSNSTGRIAVLRSPEFDFTNVSNPVLHFYVASRTYTGGEEDRIQVLVSTDGGLTFTPASTPYNKTWATDPSLATLVPSGSAYTPSDESQWRHETVDLSNVGGNPNVVIGWRATSAYGNNAWIDNVIVSQPNALCNDNVGPAPGSYSCNSAVTLHFTNTPAPPPDGIAIDNQNIQKPTERSVGQSQETGIALPGYQSGVPFIPSVNTDNNPDGGTAFVAEYYNVDPGQIVNPNVGATNPNGNTFTPAEVYWLNSSWYTVTYDGNDYTGYATYNLDIDVTGMGYASYLDLYIVKRTDQTGNWTCLTTSSPSANILRVTGLTDFCDFALAGNEVQPVELTSFISVISGRDVTLNWATTTETNNQGFDIERSSVNGSWSKIAEVAGNGTTTTAHSYSFTDRNLASGNYNYRLKQIDFNGNFEYFNLSNEVNVGIPSKFDLSQNYPNPFNPSTSINFDLPVDGKVSLKIYDMSGKEVMTLVNEVRTAGYYSVNFNASSLSSGVYFYSLSADNFTATKKMMLLK